MPPVAADASRKAPPPTAPDTIQDSRDAVAAREPRNFVILALYQVTMRMGWIFKTESIIMPAVMDSISGAGWLRGCLPLINRLGQSVPPLMAAPVIRGMRRKKWALTVCTAVMAAAFLGLSMVWFLWGGSRAWWMSVAFLALYSLFFTSTGVNQLSFGTLQGKLIETTHRGRLMLTANVAGAGSAIVCAALLLPMWLTAQSAMFQYIFGFAGICFALSAATSLLLSEPADDHAAAPLRIMQVFAGAVATLRADANFRRLGLVGALFGCSIMLFPHYQALGRQDGSGFDVLIWWVVVQNFGTALFSLPAGPLADWRGNRLVLRLLLLGICVAPLAALLLAYAGPSGRQLYFLVFVLVGLTPVTFRTLQNYTLEISQAPDHPRYLSTLSICVAVPVMLSPLVGGLIDAVGFEVVFVCIAALVLAGWLLTFTLHEPRHHRPAEELAEQFAPEH